MALKILLLTHRIPFPLNDGGAMGVHYFIDGYLQQQVSLSVLSMNTTKHFVPEKKWPSLYNNLNFFKAVPIDNKVKLLGAFKNLFSTKSYNTQRFESKAYLEALENILREHTFDIVQIDNIYLESYISTIRNLTKAKIICRIHNIEYLIWQRLADNQAKGLKKYYLQLLANRLKIVELNALKQVDLLLTINKDEQHFLKAQGIETLAYYMPFGIDSSSLQMRNVQLQAQTIFHIGSMDWKPNLEGLAWFMNKVWPLVEEKNGAVQLHIAGKNMPEYLLQNNMHNVKAHGMVPEATAFMQTYHTLIVPLLSGAGVRVKILEAISLGKHIVSTSIGASGLDLTHQKNILIADTPQAFADAIIQIMQGNYPHLGKEAKAIANSQYNKPLLFKNLIDYFEHFV